MDQGMSSTALGHSVEPSSPSAPSTPVDPARKHPAPPKRKRTGDAAASDSADSASQAPRTRDGPKKKKANRACFHCQKAHLTCDDSRPCQRCVKRGMADNCTEGHRKKAKYLLDEEELEALKHQKSGDTSKSADSIQHTGQSQPPQQPGSYMPPPNPSMYASYDAPASYPGYPTPSTNGGATLEYSIISSILNPSAPPAGPSQNGQSRPPQPAAAYVSQTPGLVTAQWPAEPQYNAGGQSASSNGYGSSGTPSTSFGPPARPSNSSDMSPPSVTESATYMRLQNSFGSTPPTSYSRPSPSSGDPSSSMSYDYQNGQQAQTPTSTTMSYGSPGIGAPFQRTRSGPSTWTASSVMTTVDGGMGQGSSNGANGSGGSAGAGGYANGTAAVATVGGQVREATSVYKMVTKKYDYTEGYHFLMKHISCRGFEKNDILRIVRALAIFRPSLIALQMPMTEEDEVFIEKCFQRSLVELDKLVSFSGTPTVAWRRTGEICLVGPEFCMLSGWEKEELVPVGRRKYIYELFENQSVVEYWENFANHAFENTTQSVYSHCVLLRPNGSPVPCTFCFSIRRDIMDLPSLVIGQWLPLL
ncbi:hypothetical protein BXZ70DRAFT_372435 [Cristinia sonorae]|uniref:Transcription activator of gluconeogenesis ERT1 n=1 Tax=Cristinia sonorae TaxID=1940300 RepID=A0A8K0UIS2_9AGAR|nr:hypothetical protein BXZ70DRAFT_372435 [Cristinia sonorae]